MSGGGAKGAYGAGVALALYRFRTLHNISSELCFIGASAGALNAAVLATSGPEKLIDFWKSATTRTVLGVTIKQWWFQAALGWFLRRPFSIYPNKALKKLIADNIALDKIEDKVLLIAATDATHGGLKVFYTGDLIDRLLGTDVTLPLRQRRLAHWRRIENQGMLVDALLASAAIPGAFPPVTIKCRVRTPEGFDTEEGLHIDGGVGNHTPTREAAYFFRYMEDLKLGQAGEVFCVRQDPLRQTDINRLYLGPIEILKRTLDVYHRIHMEPVIRGWFRINVEVNGHQQRVAAFLDWLRTQALPPGTLSTVENAVTAQLGTLGGRVPRLSKPMMEIEPASPLGDTLDFDPDRINENIERGYGEMLEGLSNKERIDDAEHDLLAGRPVFR